MAASINTDVNLNPVVSRLLESEWGLVFICIMIFLLVIGGFVYLLAKSGVMSGFTAYTEHTSKKFHKEIEYKEELLSDESLIEFKDLMEYHVKVSKLENFLKFKNKDIDLIRYILSCRDSNRAIRLYKKGSDYLEKNQETKLYQLRSKYSSEKIKKGEKLALFYYFGLNFIGVSPFFYNIYSTFNKSVFNFERYNGVIFFILFFVISLIVTYNKLRPFSALYFLELEKIPTKVDE
ncbi:hypothetical protein [Acinetobacter soli]|uniref:hypothetical protein n=1 Tax=Acinetobacter soli TaxID=487316 RepID=UPI0032B3C9EE